MKPDCVKCKKSLHLSTCEGCQQSLCEEHLLEHREDLFQVMKTIETKCQQLEEDLTGHGLIQGYLLRIDRWQRESMERIQATAEKARQDLLDLLARMQSQVKVTFTPLHEEIRLRQRSSAHPERKVSQWMDRLKELHQILQSSLKDDPIHDDTSSIPLIKVHEKEHSFITEKFEKSSGAVLLSNDRRTATCSGSNWNGSTVRGHQLYSSGTHSIRFEIKRRGKHNLFFGITSAAIDPNPWNRRRPPSAFGWWEFLLTQTDDPRIKAGDQVTLTLDCDNRHIQLEHHRTQQRIDESISYEQCPFPWKIALVLYSPQDSVRILP